MLGPATELLAETTSPFLWGIVAASDGSLYVGSGNEGKVFKIDSAGKTTTFFDSTELEVHALALANDGTLYAATSPDGRIYKIDRSGKAAPFFDPEDKYIWSLALDRDGQLYAGTGEKGHDLQNHAGRQRRAVLSDQSDARDYARVRSRRPAAGRHRRAWAPLPHRFRRKSDSCCSTRHSRKCAR